MEITTVKQVDDESKLVTEDFRIQQVRAEGHDLLIMTERVVIRFTDDEIERIYAEYIA